MTNYGKQYSMTQPKEIEITDEFIFLAKNITQSTLDIDGHEVVQYEYDLTSYNKNEFFELQNEKIQALEQELQATKILLGVD